jgi:hypothetical protein
MQTVTVRRDGPQILERGSPLLPIFPHPYAYPLRIGVAHNLVGRARGALGHEEILEKPKQFQMGDPIVGIALVLRK